MAKVILFPFFCFFFIALGSSFSQQNVFENTFYTDMRKSFSCQGFSLNIYNDDSIEAIVVYKYSRNNLTFEKTPANPPNLLRGIGLIEAIFRDEIGIIQKIVTRTDTLFKEENPKQSQIEPDNIGVLIARIPKGNYHVEVNLYDRRIIKQKTLKIELKAIKMASVILSTLVFVSKNNPFSYSVLPMNYLNFKGKNKAIIFGIQANSKPKKIHYLIKSTIDKTDKLVWTKNIKFSGDLNELNAQQFVFDSLRLMLNVSGEAGKDYYYELEIPEKFAFPQKYICFLTFDDKTNDTLKFEFQIKWENTPLSLRNIQYAIDLMYYILTDEEFESLKATKKDYLSTKFFEIWKRFDVDTTTLFNEAMEEYYSRVDFAFFNFQTIYEPDGAKTDRGKIYILYGKPDTISREIDKSGIVREVWVYPTLHQVFVFQQIDGKFTLKEIRNI